MGKSLKVGFICTGNSARSQMAEGFARYYADKFGKKVEVFSAGSNPSGYVHPLAVKVMEERGIDISHQKSKSLEDIPFDFLNVVVTLCGDAAESCPVVDGAKVIHWGLPDPAKVQGEKEERLKAFRVVRDEIEEKVKNLLEQL